MSKNIADVVRKLAEPVAAELGYDIWDIEYVREGATMILRITIDSEDGISLDDCEKFHRAIDPKLDEADPIEDSYTLEVSSPGIERVLTRPEHFEIMKGWEIEVRLFSALKNVPALSNTRQFNGILEGIDGSDILVGINGETVRVPRKAAAKVTTVYDWDNEVIPDIDEDEDDEEDDTTEEEDNR